MIETVLFFAPFVLVLFLKGVSLPLTACVALLLAGAAFRPKYAGWLSLATSVLLLPVLGISWGIQPERWGFVYLVFMVSFTIVSALLFWGARWLAARGGQTMVILALALMVVSAEMISRWFGSVRQGTATYVALWAGQITPFVLFSLKESRPVFVRSFTGAIFPFPLQTEGNLPSEKLAGSRREAVVGIWGCLAVAVLSIAVMHHCREAYGFGDLSSFLWAHPDAAGLSPGQARTFLLLAFINLQLMHVLTGNAAVACLKFLGVKVPWNTQNIFLAADFYTFFHRYAFHYACLLSRLFFSPLFPVSSSKAKSSGYSGPFFSPWESGIRSSVC